MRKWITYLLWIGLTAPLFAQLNYGTYDHKSNNSQLTLSDNGYFHYQTHDNLFYRYLRGKWKTENDLLILMENYHSEKNENLHFIGKSPKFNYTTAQRITTFKINGKELILSHQEIIPSHAKFMAELGNYFTFKTDYENK